MEEKTMQNADDRLELEGFGPQEAKELKHLLSRFMKEYGKKPAGQTDEEWLKQRFLAELPNLSEEEAAELSRETMASIHEYDQNLDSLKKARSQGKTTEEWFADKTQEAAAGIATAEFGAHLGRLDTVLEQANTQMMRTITTQSGEISQQMNLDGFIAEQQHVNTFNAAAEVSGSPYRAMVCAPEPGQTYGKNSFDVVIKDQSGKIAHQYQFKYEADAEATIAMIKRGNYNNQTLVVPPEQVEAVKAAFPGKTVVSKIGATEKVQVSSTPLSKAEVKALQKQAQEKGAVAELNWGAYDSRMLAKHVGQRAAVAGVQGAVIATGFHLAAKAVADEPIDTEAVVSVALETGVDTGVKAAAAGALKVAAEKNLIGVIPPGTPAHIIANIACVAIENVKILKKAASGEITMGEAMEEMGCTTTSMVVGLTAAAKGAAIGVAALGWIPFVGPVAGGVVGGTVGYMAGSKVGQTIYETAKKVKETAKKTAAKLWERGKERVRNSIAGRLAGKIFG